MNRIARLPFERAHDAVASVARIQRADFLAGQDLYPVPIIAVEPVLGVIGVAGRVEMRVGEHPAERAILVVVDVTRGAAPAVFGEILIAAAAFVILTANV